MDGNIFEKIHIESPNQVTAMYHCAKIHPHCTKNEFIH